MVNKSIKRSLRSPADVFDLRGRVVLIMGGAGKMGQAFAEILSNAGATVCLVDLSLDYSTEVAREINERTVGRVIGRACDLSSKSEIMDLFSDVLDCEGEIHTVIYNVYSKPHGYYRKFEKYELDTWEKVMASNINGAFLTCQEAINCFRDKNIEGNIILTLSTYGVVSPNLNIYAGLESVTNIYGGTDPLTTPLAYSVSKSGLLGMVKYLACAYGEYGIRVNGFTPGGVFDGQEQSFVDAYEDRTPMRRMANWDDYTGPMLFLVSDASRYMTGSNLVVDGGWTAW